MAEQAATKFEAMRLAVVTDIEGQAQVEHDVIVIARVKRDALRGAGGRDASKYIKRAVAVERCDLDRNDVVDCRKGRPEIDAKLTPADSRLQIKPDQRDFVCDGAAMLDDVRR